MEPTALIGRISIYIAIGGLWVKNAEMLIVYLLETKS